jgi:hypothetical protein
VKLLLDECVTRFLKRDFVGHEGSTVEDAGLKGLENGDLLKAAAGIFDVLVTVDCNIPHQQKPNRVADRCSDPFGKAKQLCALEASRA